MSSPRALAQSFTITPAVCRAEYPAGGGNHILHVSETERGESRDGYVARRPDGVRFYLTRDDSGKWSAQRMTDASVAENWYVRFDFPSRATLLISLATVKP